MAQHRLHKNAQCTLPASYLLTERAGPVLLNHASRNAAAEGQGQGCHDAHDAWATLRSLHTGLLLTRTSGVTGSRIASLPRISAQNKTGAEGFPSTLYEGFPSEVQDMAVPHTNTLAADCAWWYMFMPHMVPHAVISNQLFVPHQQTCTMQPGARHFQGSTELFNSRQENTKNAHIHGTFCCRLPLASSALLPAL